jgi:hypothetical protein
MKRSKFSKEQIVYAIRQALTFLEPLGCAFPNVMGQCE